MNHRIQLCVLYLEGKVAPWAESACGWSCTPGYGEKQQGSQRLPHLQFSRGVKKVWKPQLFQRELYSEILDTRFTVTVTMRTLDLIDGPAGLTSTSSRQADQHQAGVPGEM